MHFFNIIMTSACSLFMLLHSRTVKKYFFGQVVSIKNWALHIFLKNNNVLVYFLYF